jgi:hypothetical protein
MSNSKDPTAPVWLTSQAATMRDKAYTYHMELLCRGRCTLAEAVLAIRAACRDAHRLMAGYRV